MTLYIYDMDGTLTPARKPMTGSFAQAFLPWLKSHVAFIATGSDYKKVCEQLPAEIIKAFNGIYASMGNTFYKGNKLLYRKDIEYDDNLLADLESFRKTTRYPYPLFDNYIEKRIGMINFSVIGRDCPYQEREKYTQWDQTNKERLHIQKVLTEKYPAYDFECGGNISLDIIPKGCGKGQIAHDLRQKYPNEKIIFLGDRTYAGGNDYALAAELLKLGNAQVVQVANPDEVLNYLKNPEFNP